MDATPQFSAAALAQRLGGRLVGDGNCTVRNVAPLEAAGPDDLSWVGSSEHLPRLAASRAGVVLIPQSCEPPADRTTIQVSDPDLSLCTILADLAPVEDEVPPGVDPAARVHETAEIADGASVGPFVYVGPQARVAAGTRLHPGVHVGAHSQIGRDCVLHPNVVLRAHTVLGERVVLHANVSIGADGYGYLQRDGRNVKIPQIGRVVIEDDVEIGANACVDRARSGETRIGRGTKIDNLVQIGHNVRIGEHCIIVSQTGISGSATLGNYVMLGGQVGIADHARVGDRVMIAAKSGIRRYAEDGAVLRGIPAVDNAKFLRQEAAARRLPTLVQQVRDLLKRVEKLESSTDH
jgi:UDP-3-O-[3-hydroxymyristoyl] glucosamine N-acyltransferase